MAVVSFRPNIYEAKKFSASTVSGTFKASGTLCGNIDFVIPGYATLCLSSDEVKCITIMLQQSRQDVLDNSDPLHDPRIID